MPGICPWDDAVVSALKASCMSVHTAKAPTTLTALLVRLMDTPGVPMHYPYHHFITPAALLTLAAMERGTGADTLSAQLSLAEERARTVPGGFCGNCGACGAAIGAGIFVSVFTGGSPMSVENWQWANEVTSLCLHKIASCPGPRCCKRVTFLASQAAVPYLNEVCGLSLSLDEEISCHFHNKNPDCLERDCPFYPAQGGGVR